MQLKLEQGFSRCCITMMTLTVLSFNLLGDALRDIFDPRLRGTAAGA